VLRGGEPYFSSLIRLIDEAKESIYLQVYILEADTTGMEVMNRLVEADRRGVKVFLLVDGFGSYGLFRRVYKVLEGTGIAHRYFAKVSFESFRQPARRLHIKVCVVDGSSAILGGINISDRYRGDVDAPPWLDYALAFSGPLCAIVKISCDDIYQRRVVRKKNLDRAVNTLLDVQIQDPQGIKLRLSINDWLRGRNDISRSYRSAIRTASSEITVLNSYFIPSTRLLRMLIRAAKRGCRVRILLSSQSDVPVVKAAIRHLYARLLRSGIRIFEYTPAVLHAKVCIVDRKWCTIGSHNLNHLSEFFSMEMNVDVDDVDVSNSFAVELDGLFEGESKEILSEEFSRTRSWWVRIGDYLAFRVIRATRWLFSLFSRHHPFQP
jgi:cardiolipin synthase